MGVYGSSCRRVNQYWYLSQVLASAVQVVEQAVYVLFQMGLRLQEKV